MAATKGNGRNAGHAAPAKELTDNASNSTAATCDLVLTTTTEPLIDSRLLAQGFANKRRAVIALIDKYLSRFERFGKVRFKKAPLDR